MGSELERRGVALPLPLWTSAALIDTPEEVAAVHRDHARAGAQVHTTATFRTRARCLAPTAWVSRWQELARRAVELAREAIGPHARLAGSLAPLEDCYHPERTPDDGALAREHEALARCLADAGCDLLLVETMPTARELLAATRAARATGLPVWAAVTLGPGGDFFEPGALREAQAAVAEAGASAFGVNCTPPDACTRALEALGPPSGIERIVYANDLFDDAVSWTPVRYAEEAALWVERGATILGTCCGTTLDHLRVLRERLAGEDT